MEWINIKDQLPTNGKEVLVYTSRNRTISTGSYYRNKNGNYWLGNYGENDDIDGKVKY